MYPRYFKNVFIIFLRFYHYNLIIIKIKIFED